MTTIFLACALILFASAWMLNPYSLKKRARKTLAIYQKIYSEEKKQTLPPANRPEFLPITRTLEKIGYRAAGDYESVAAGETYGPIRAFIGMDGKVTAVAYLRHGNIAKRSPVATTFYTELSDGRWLVSEPSLGTNVALLTRPDNVERSLFSPVSPPAKLAADHERRVQETLAQNPNVHGVVVHDLGQTLMQTSRFWAVVCAYRKSIGWITEAELAAMTKDPRRARNLAAAIDRIRPSGSHAK